MGDINLGIKIKNLEEKAVLTSEKVNNAVKSTDTNNIVTLLNANIGAQTLTTNVSLDSFYMLKIAYYWYSGSKVSEKTVSVESLKNGSVEIQGNALPITVTYVDNNTLSANIQSQHSGVVVTGVSFSEAMNTVSERTEPLNVFGTSDQWYSKSWAKDEICIDDNKLWKCLISNSNKPSEGSQWTQISLKDLAHDMRYKIEYSDENYTGDLNDLATGENTMSIVCAGQSATNNPVSKNGIIVFTFRILNNAYFKIQIAFAHTIGDTSNIAFMRTLWNGSWSEWVTIK